MRLICPHCGDKTRIRTTKTLSPIYREAYVQCTAPECGWSGKARVEIAETFNPSRQPNPDVRLFVSPEARIALLAQLQAQKN
ncbi:ogr/Delta-like zinc finger family protein [Halomonas sp. M20]|uniref:ogr/Delta-like zinc finger family protein n=1 Tax=Halomonas sp. M20 TaxID=2763264 RepID=UPI001D0B9D07|nr:ogr/Delta-like zinc finger family protein [Halomonas sp. M20]